MLHGFRAFGEGDFAQARSSDWESLKGNIMTTALESQADQLLMYSREVEHLQSQLTYLSTAIASAAVDGDTTSSVFQSLVLAYKTARDQHATAKQAYTNTLNGE